MPLEVPSALGLTITGKRKGRSFSLPVVRSCQLAVSMSAARRICLARLLSRQMARVVGSEPVYGMPSISQSAGTCASRPRPRRPSATLKTTSGCAPARDIGRSASASRGTTMCPYDSMAAEMAAIVLGESNSASSSPASRFMLNVSPTRRAFLGRRAASDFSVRPKRLHAALTSARSVSSRLAPFASFSAKRQSVAVSAPTQGRPSSSKMAGNRASRVRPRAPSARFTTRSGGVASRRAMTRAGEPVMSIRSTS